MTEVEKEVNRLKKLISDDTATAENLESGGEMTRTMAQDTWLVVFQNYRELINITTKNSGNGILARRGAVVSALKAREVEIARDCLSTLVEMGNISPHLFEELHLLFRDGRGSE